MEYRDVTNEVRIVVDNRTNTVKSLIRHTRTLATLPNDGVERSPITINVAGKEYRITDDTFLHSGAPVRGQ